MIRAGTMIAKTFKRLTSTPDKAIRKGEPQRYPKVARWDDERNYSVN
jgi:hypothetical protein